MPYYKIYRGLCFLFSLFFSTSFYFKWREIHQDDEAFWENPRNISLYGIDIFGMRMEKAFTKEEQKRRLEVKKIRQKKCGRETTWPLLHNQMFCDYYSKTLMRSNSSDELAVGPMVLWEMQQNTGCLAGIPTTYLSWGKVMV